MSSMITDQILRNECRDQEGNRKRLRKEQIREASSVWQEFDSARTAFALQHTRTNYNRLKTAGDCVVEMQSRIGVWLIHPANVVPGLSENDSRILE